MTRLSKALIKKYYFFATHLAARISRKYYFEDYVRVYPDGLAYQRWGKRRKLMKETLNNFLNHQKFYKFAGQFVKDKVVADIGCGSGHGCEVLNHSGAARVYGADISKHSIRFAKKRFGDSAHFSIQGITDMKNYPNNTFDVSILSEVLEHIKEYSQEQKAVSEIKRVTKEDGLIIISTPNTELSKDHGFSYDELNQLLGKNFKKYCIFENALAPWQPEQKITWQKRCEDGRVGIVVSANINLNETAFLPPNPALKRGIDPGFFQFASFRVDTGILHNTHSWVALALNSKSSWNASLDDKIEC